MSRGEPRLSLINLEHGKEGFLWYLHAADFLHPLFAFFLFFEKLAFAADVAAVSFRDDVFAEGFYGFAGNDLVADGGLDRYFKELSRDEFLHLCREEASF